MINDNLKQINKIQKKISLIESEGTESAFLLPHPARPELKVYFEDLVTELESMKLPSSGNKEGFHWMADQKRFHLLKQ